MQDHGRLDPAETCQPVEGELREPLLVDPPGSLRERHQVVVLGQPVLGHLAAAHEGQPAVADQLGLGETRKQDCVEGDEYQRQRLAAEKARERGQAATKRRHDHAIDMSRLRFKARRRSRARRRAISIRV